MSVFVYSLLPLRKQVKLLYGALIFRILFMDLLLLLLFSVLELTYSKRISIARRMRICTVFIKLICNIM